MIARVRNTANIAISSFNYLWVKQAMCHVFPDFLEEGRKPLEAGVADRNADIFVAAPLLDFPQSFQIAARILVKNTEDKHLATREDARKPEGLRQQDSGNLVGDGIRNRPLRDAAGALLNTKPRHAPK